MANEQNESSTRFRPEISRRVPDFHTIPHAGGSSEADTGKQLIVGREIVLNGEIATCDKLVVEGTVEAKLGNSRVIEVAETGFFKGAAEIDDAVISGRFEGNLTVRGLLTVRATGRISGEVRYGRLAVEEGGVILGSVEMIQGGGTVRPIQPAGGVD